MSTSRFNLKINQGSTFYQPFIWEAGGAPVDLTDWKGRMQIRPDPTSSTIHADLTTENGGLIMKPLEGGFAMYMTAEQTAELEFDDAEYDLELISTNGTVIRRLEGIVRLSLEVTR